MLIIEINVETGEQTERELTAATAVKITSTSWIISGSGLT